MRDLDSIRELNREAVLRAARASLRPFFVESEDVVDFQNGNIRALKEIPHIGKLLPKGWARVNIFDEFGEDFDADFADGYDDCGIYLVDSSGLGADDEEALTLCQFADVVRPGYGYAVVDAGEYQVKVGVFRRLH